MFPDDICVIFYRKVNKKIVTSRSELQTNNIIQTLLRKIILAVKNENKHRCRYSYYSKIFSHLKLSL